MNPYRNFDLEELANKINTFSLRLQDYEMVTPSLARVILAYTGAPPVKEEIRANITRLLNGMAAPVEGSFRILGHPEQKVVLGFVYSASDVRDYDEQNMKVMASNLLMDKADESLWEVRSGNTGKYLVKQGDEDLSELVHLAMVRQTSMPVLAQVAMASTIKREFATFVDAKSQEVMHGFVVEVNGPKLTVAVYEDEGKPVEIEEAQIVEVSNLDDEVRPTYSKMAPEVAASKTALVEYYKKAYGYDPAYVQLIINMINQHSFA